MRFIQPAQVEGLERLSPVGWRSTADDGVLIFELSADPPPFICFFLSAGGDAVAPKIAFDQGSGFDEAGAVTFRAFPFGFYHVALRAIGPVRRVRLRACKGHARFRCLAFETARPVPVAVLHYLFNLRYQKIGLVAPAPGGARGRLAYIKSNAARIRTFFSTISVGGGLRVQQTDDDVLERLRFSQTALAKPVQAEMRRRLAPQEGAPLISFVAPAYNSRPEHLTDLLASFAAQEAPYAELILVDDGSTSAATIATLADAATKPGVRLCTLPRNGGIAAATNVGIDAALGDWVSFIDHDDLFVGGAVAVIAAAILANPAAIFFYTDEIIANAALKPVGSFCKPAFDSVLLSCMNYINHFSVFRRARLAALGGLSTDCEGSQDYDLLLRYLADAEDGSVIHIPYLAYIWRRGEGSYSAVHRERSVANARRALATAYRSSFGSDRAVEPGTNPDLHRVRFPQEETRMVSVVVPNRDSLSLISRVVDDLQKRTVYPDIEIVVVDNGSTDPEVLRFYEARTSDRFRVDLFDEPFNFAKMCNRGARLARSDLILFLNDDIEVIEPDWLGEMVECLAYGQVGIVGAKLLYPNGRIQHAGVIVGLGAAAGHWYINDEEGDPGPMGRLAARQTMSAVTGACMLVTRPCFVAVGGFDEDAFPIAYNDVDLCLRAGKVGYRTVWTPFATLVHHESVSRGLDDQGPNNARFRLEFSRLQDRHGTMSFIDPAYSPFYDRRYSRPHLITPPMLPSPRRNRFG